MIAVSLTLSCNAQKDSVALTAGERHLSMPSNRSGLAERPKADPARAAESQPLNERAKSLQDNLQVILCPILDSRHKGYRILIRHSFQDHSLM